MVHWRSTALLGGSRNLEHVEGWSKVGSLELCWKERLGTADTEQWWTRGTQLQVLKEFEEELGGQREVHEGLRNISWRGCRVSSRWEGRGWGGNLRPFHSERPVSTGLPLPSVLSYCLGSQPAVCTWLWPTVGLCKLLFPSAPCFLWALTSGGAAELEEEGTCSFLFAVSACTPGHHRWLQPLLLSTHQNQTPGAPQRSQHQPDSTPFSFLPASSFWWQTRNLNVNLV